MDFDRCTGKCHGGGTGISFYPELRPGGVPKDFYFGRWFLISLAADGGEVGAGTTRIVYQNASWVTAYAEGNCHTIRRYT